VYLGFRSICRVFSKKANWFVHFPKAEVTDSNSVWGIELFTKRFAGENLYVVIDQIAVLKTRNSIFTGLGYGSFVAIWFLLRWD